MIKYRAWVKPEILSNHMDGVIAEAKPDFIEKGCLVRRIDLKSDECFLEIIDIDDVILMQSTGLKDKNGVEIFEGDVVKPDRGEPFVVKYFIKCQGIIKQVGISTSGHSFEGIYGSEELEVIGNIYANPELLS